MSLLAACMCWFVRVSLCGVGMKERGRRGACSLNTGLSQFPFSGRGDGMRNSCGFCSALECTVLYTQPVSRCLSSYPLPRPSSL